MQGRIWILFWWTDDFRSVKRQGIRCKVPSLRVQEDHILLPWPIRDPDDHPHDQGEGAGICPHNHHPKPCLFPWVHLQWQFMPAEPCSFHQSCLPLPSPPPPGAWCPCRPWPGWFSQRTGRRSPSRPWPSWPWLGPGKWCKMFRVKFPACHNPPSSPCHNRGCRSLCRTKLPWIGHWCAAAGGCPCCPSQQLRLACSYFTGPNF